MHLNVNFLGSNWLFVISTCLLISYYDQLFFLVLQALVKMCSKLSLVDKLCSSVNIDMRILLARVLLTIGDVHTSYHSIHLWNRASGSPVMRTFAQKLTMEFSVALSGRPRDECNFFSKSILYIRQLAL